MKAGRDSRRVIPVCRNAAFEPLDVKTDVSRGSLGAIPFVVWCGSPPPQLSQEVNPANLGTYATTFRRCTLPKAVMWGRYVCYSWVGEWGFVWVTTKVDREMLCIAAP